MDVPVQSCDIASTTAAGSQIACIAAYHFDSVSICVGLHAFGHHVESRLCDIVMIARAIAAPSLSTEVCGERVVSSAVQRQDAQARREEYSRPEVVDRDRDARQGDGAADLRRAKSSTSADGQLQSTAASERRRRRRFRHARGECIPSEMRARHVDADGHRRKALFPPGVVLDQRRDENPFPDRHDQPGLLRNADEVLRPQHAERGVVPANQRLDADDAVRRDIDLRLVVQLELLAFDRAPQVVPSDSRSRSLRSN